MNKYENDWWRQPRREWEEEHWGEPVIPGRPNVDGELPEVTKPATDQDCKEEAERIKRRLLDEPSAGNSGGGGGRRGGFVDSGFVDDGDDGDNGNEPSSGNSAGRGGSGGRGRNGFVSGGIDGGSGGSGSGGGGNRNVDAAEGIDACAFYLSFRYKNQRRWGIYIGLECWFWYAKFLFDGGVPADAAVDEAFYLLYRHEYFHFEVDKAIEIMERGVGISTGTKPKAWLNYHQSNNPSKLEEALANAHAYEHAGKRHKKVVTLVKGLVKTIFSIHGPGYRDFADVSGSKVKGDARSQLISEIMGIHKNDNRFVSGLQSLIRPPSFVNSKDPIPRMNYEGETLNVYFF